MKALFRFKYPKILLLLIAVIASSIIFSNQTVDTAIAELGKQGYIVMYLAGICFSFGFTTPFAIGYFLVAEPSSILLATIVGGLGALTGDMLIYKMIKVSFMDEFKRLEKTIAFKFMKSEFDRIFSKRVKIYVLYALAGIVIASPFPDEIGVSMLAGLSTIKLSRLSIISFIMNSIGILAMLLI